MFDVAQQITHLKRDALQDWDVAQELVSNRRYRHGLFFAHLALEKMLKAHVVKLTADVPPRIHNLTLLATRANLNLKPIQVQVLADMNEFNIQGRYPDYPSPRLTAKITERYMMQTKELLLWLRNQL